MLEKRSPNAPRQPKIATATTSAQTIGTLAQFASQKNSLFNEYPCVEIMLHYYRLNPLASFGFVAAPDLESDLRSHHGEIGRLNRRYILYKRLMLNWFGSQTFLQVSDTGNTIYLLVNQAQLASGSITISDIERQINQIYTGDYTF